MRRTTSTVRKDVPALAALACILLLGLAFEARADVSIYQAVVPLKGAAEADRTAAFGEALRAAVVRATGQRDAGSNPVIAAAAADPARYVQQYSATADRLLKVGFDARAMDQLMQKAGLPLWPLERPVTRVLLVVASVAGGSRAIVEGDRGPERAEVERAAQARGLPVSWPRESVDVARVRSMLAGGDAEAGVQAGSGSQPVLAGVGGGGEVSWRFVQSGQSARADGSIEAGVNLAADSLAARYAPPSTRGLSQVTVRVGGIGDVRTYAGMLECLKSLSLVRAISVKEMTGGVVTLELALRGDLELLRRIAALEGRLSPGPAPGPEGVGAVDFTYLP
jgi:hypothetical protein